MRINRLGYGPVDAEARGAGWVIAAIGIVLSLVVLTDPFLRPDKVWLFELIIELSLSATLIYGGYRLARSDIDAERLLEIDVLCLKGMFALGGFAAGLIVAAKVSGWPVADPYFVVQTLVTSGAVLGFVVGVAGTLAPKRVERLGSADPAGPTTVPSAVVDSWLDVLSDRRCQFVLRQAMNAPDGSVTLDELAVDDVLGVRIAEVDLYHGVLPKLRDVRLVDYDERTETIRYRTNPAFEELFETVERYRRRRRSGDGVNGL